MQKEKTFLIEAKKIMQVVIIGWLSMFLDIALVNHVFLEVPEN